ncbi:YciI family protein [Nonomuraea sp. SYSU D8015]|uniref:YciI family protein n=1 Tax=Nonomuraea sp. SYSU D8015 TaxID=2593644 RepID=UPI001660F3F6|nr:YciI family protein [Nonomuraea sp. SYSU D8015]
MKQYVLTMYQPDGAPPGPEILDPIMRDLDALDQEMRDAGVWVFSRALQPADQARVIQMRDGEPLTTDGPYVEGKEHVGGFTIIQAPDMETALAWGRKMARAVALLPVEVREFQG